MSDSAIIEVLSKAFWIALKLAVPMLSASLIVGLVISVFQAATQIHEQTLTFVPKLVVVGLLLVVLAPWMLSTMRDFVIEHFTKMLDFI